MWIQADCHNQVHWPVTGKTAAIPTSLRAEAWAGQPTHSQEIITGTCPHYCGPENQDGDK